MKAALLALCLLAAPAAAAAQDAPLFATGPLTWSPGLALRDFGWDSNVFDSPDNPVFDLTGTLAPEIELTFDTSRLRMSGTGSADLIYYEKLAAQRTINSRVSGRVEAPLAFLVPFFSGAVQFARDRQQPEIDTPSRHNDRDLSLGAAILYGTRVALQIAGRRQEVSYAPGQSARGVELAQALNRRSEQLMGAIRVNITPLTSLLLDGTSVRDKYLVNRQKNQHDLRGTIGVEFAPDAVIRGRATFGYHALKVSDPDAVPYKGPTFDIDLSYVLLEVTRFDGRYRRDTTASVEGPYYLDTSYGLEVTQAFLGPTELLIRANRQQSSYPGIPSRSIASRLDRTERYAGGVGIRLTESTRMTVTYERSRRRSVLERLVFRRDRVLTSVTLGF